MPEEKNLNFNNNDRIAKYISYIPRHITNARNTNIETTTMCTIGSIADSIYKYLKKKYSEYKINVILFILQNICDKPRLIHVITLSILIRNTIF